MSINAINAWINSPFTVRMDPALTDELCTMCNKLHHGYAVRGMIFDGTIEEAIEKYTPGTQCQVGLSSYSTDFGVAFKFAGGRMEAKANRTSIMILPNKLTKTLDITVQNPGEKEIISNDALIVKSATKEWIGDRFVLVLRTY